MRELVLDEMLDAALADELRARGRPARALSPPGRTDDEAASAAGDGVLVTTVEHHPPGTTIALITAQPGAPRREAVHRHAHEIAAKRPGSLKRY